MDAATDPAGLGAARVVAAALPVDHSVPLPLLLASVLGLTAALVLAFAGWRTRRLRVRRVDSEIEWFPPPRDTESRG